MMHTLFEWGQGFGAAKADAGGRGKKRTRRDFHGQRFSNQAHRSTRDPDARLARRSKPQGALLRYRGHVFL